MLRNKPGLFVMCDEVLQVGLVHKGRCMFVIFENDTGKILLGAGVLCLGGSELSWVGFLACRDPQCPGGLSKSLIASAAEMWHRK